MKLAALILVGVFALVAFSPADPTPAPLPAWELFQNPAFRDRPNGVELP